MSREPQPFRIIAAFAAAATLAGGLAACTAPPTAPEDRHLSVAVDELAPGSWNPAVHGRGLEHLAAQAVYDTLATFASDGSFEPRLATAYEVADDKMSIRIELRDDVEFVDGVHMDAAGVEKWFDYLLTSDGYGFRANAEAFGIEFTATGDYELELTATTPLYHPDDFVYDTVRLLFQATPVLSPAVVDDPESADTEPIGSGPYRITEYIPDVEIHLERNPDYWDPGAYAYDTLEFRLLADPIAKLNALKSGQVDAAPLLAEQVAEAESSGLTISHGSPVFYTLFVRDPVASPLEPLRDVRVRQAMALAFDREAIAETLDLGYGRASSQVFIEGQAEYIEGGDDRYGYDLDRARELMADAGYADGFDLVIPSQAAYAPVQPIVQQALGDIGIRVTFDIEPDVLSYLGASMGGEYPVAMYLMNTTNIIRLFDEEFAGLGSFFEPSPELAELLPIIRFGSAEDSAEASRELGELVLDEVWQIPFSRPAQFWGADPEVVVVPMDDVSGFSGLRTFRLPE